MKDYSLQIAHTLVVDAAYYTCVATNIAGQDEGTTHLNIGSKEEFNFELFVLRVRLSVIYVFPADFLVFSRYFNLVIVRNSHVIP